MAGVSLYLEQVVILTLGIRIIRVFVVHEEEFRRPTSW